MSYAVDNYFLALQSALAGRYSLEREVGRGGMGVVYLAREVRLDRPVALKVLPPHLAAYPELRDRFLREANTAAQLSHPNIVPIYAVDEVEDFVFFTMPYIQGQTLAQRISARGPLSAGDGVRILREVAWALAYAHAHGVVHRDVKPDNILLEEATNRTLVADFGIARVLRATGLTGQGELIGTPEFMSPEQASGSDVDARSDIYSLGVVGYFALSGKLPFEGASVQEVLAKHLTQPAVPLSSLVPAMSRPISRIIEQCLAKEPSARFANSEALAEALDQTQGKRQDIPVPVRLWLLTRLRFSIARALGYAGIGVLLGFAFLENLFLRTRRPILPLKQVVLFVPLGLGLILGWAVLCGIIGLYPIRRLLAAGYGLEDIRVVIKRAMAIRAEEVAYQSRRKPSPAGRLIRWLTLAALAMAGGLVGFQAFRPELFDNSRLADGFELFIGCIVASAVTGLFIPGRYARGLGLEYHWHRYFWMEQLGVWYVKLAGLGLPAAALPAMTNRPTELVIGLAADDLFKALTRQFRDELRELPRIVRRLEAHAQAVRKRVDELGEMVAEAESPSQRVGQSSGLAQDELSARRKALIDDLRTEQEAGRQRLSSVLAALETIRLDLMRLRGGVGSVATITADLAAAAKLGDQVDRLLASAEEVTQIVAVDGDH